MITAALMFELCDEALTDDDSTARSRSGVRAVSGGADAMAGTKHGELLVPLVENENDSESKAGSGKREKKRVLRE